MTTFKAAGKRHGTTIGLVVIALALAVVVLVIDRGEVTTQEASERQSNLFDAWRPAEVNQIVLTTGGQRIELRRDTETEGDSALWDLAIDGREVEADEMAVSELLATLEYATFERLVSLSDPAVTGLDKPTMELTLSMGKLSWMMRIGAAAPSPPGASYAEIQGGGRAKPLRCVLTKQFLEALKSRAKELRSRDITPYQSSALHSVSWTAAGSSKPHWTLSRSDWGAPGAGPFALEAPDPIGKVRADHRAVGVFFAGLVDLEAERFLPPPPPGRAQASRLELSPKTGETGIIDIAADPRCSPALLVSREPSPTIACVARARIEAIEMTADKLVDRYAVGAKGTDIIEVKVTHKPAGVLEVARKGEGWHMRAPADSAADNEAVDDWLDRALKAQGKYIDDQETSDLAAIGLAEPQAVMRVISLAVRGGSEEQIERTERIDIGQPVGDKTYIYRNEDSTILELSSEVARPLAATASLLRSTKIFDYPLRRFRSLTLRGCDKAAPSAAPPRLQRLNRKRGGDWTLVAPKHESLRADMGLANELSEKYGQLRAIRWVGDKPEEAFGLAKPWCQIEAVVQLPAEGDDPDDAPKRTLGLKLGAKAADGYYAQRGEEPGVFIVPTALAAAASSWLLDRAGLLIALEPLEKVEVIGKDGQPKLVVNKKATGWTLVGEGPKSAALTVRDVIKGLVAEGVLHLGPAEPEEGLGEPIMVLRMHNKGDDKPTEIAIGAGEIFRETRVYYARHSGIDASYAVARARIQPLLDLL